MRVDLRDLDLRVDLRDLVLRVDLRDLVLRVDLRALDLRVDLRALDLRVDLRLPESSNIGSSSFFVDIDFNLVLNNLGLIFSTSSIFCNFSLSKYKSPYKIDIFFLISSNLLSSFIL